MRSSSSRSATFSGVHAGRRFVQRQQPGLGRQRAGDLQTALVAVGEIPGAVMGELADADILQQRMGLVAHRLFFLPGAAVAGDRRPQAVAGAYVAADHHVFQHAHFVEQPQVLEGASDAGLRHFIDRLGL